MKTAWTFIIVFVLGSYSQVMAQPSPSQNLNTGLPGIQQIITQYGDQLNLTDDQKTELIRISKDQRMRPDRRHSSAWRGSREMNRDRNERPQRRERRENMERGDTTTARQISLYQKVYEVLSDEQTETLKSLLTEHAERQHEYRILRNEELVTRTGIEGDKAEQVKDIFNRQSQIHTELAIQRIQNPGETNREMMQEAIRSMREGNREMMNILTAAEYQNLQRLMSPRSHRQQPPSRRSASRTR